ncbi:Reverse transcriptase (RNA-dependent DNA polymerase) [Popillia japonica]|uniref:Reverse transcriptase (RNA-dependent DNA polymerase) n=1 Tax=Popillia japonica TaxID=7064 RepID=A0AAW1MXF0_POPJA
MSFQQAKNIDQFYARLLKLSKTCNFNKPEDEIKCQIILNTTNSGLRRYALNEQPDLEKLLTHARTMEQTDNHIKSMENTQVVNFTSKPQNKNKHKKVSLQVSNQKCKNCGNNWHSQGRQSCPAKDVTCFKCNRTGHFAKVCLSKAAETKRKGKQSYVKDNKPRVNNTDAVEQNSDEESFKDNKPRVNNTDAVEQNSDEESFNIHMYSVESTKTPRIEVIIDKTPVTCIIDSGSSVNVIIDKTPVTCISDSGSSVNVVSADTFYNLNDKLRLSKDNTKIYAYNSKQQLPLLGFFESKEQTKIIKDKFPELFQGTGKLKGNEVHLFIDPTVVPVAQKHRRLPFSIRDKVKEELKRLEQNDIIELDQHRRLPFSIRDKVKEELKRLEQNDIIELVTTPTPWLSPIVVVPKPNNTNAIRMCVDMRCANMAIKRVRHLTPTIDDIIVTLNGSKFFSKLDLDGYHQLVLDKQSRGITSFSTHVGTYRYKKLNFGINAAAEIFQDTVRQVLVGIAGVINVSDDILVFGKSQEEHDVALESVLERLKQSGLTLNERKSVLERLKQSGLTLNERKCAFKKTSIHFLGFIGGGDK